MTSAKRIVLTGGGSAGHIYPLLAVADNLKRLAIDYAIVLELYYVGPADGYAEEIESDDIHIRTIFAGKLRRYVSLHNLIDVPKFFIGLLQAFWKIFWLMPDGIFSKGGTGALPVVLAGWFYRIPVIIHDSDSVPGLTNIVSAKFASRIGVSFEHALKFFSPNRTAWIGNPVRPELLINILDTERAKEKLGFNSKEPLILILGGSQGSERINEFIVANLIQILAVAQVFHQTGKAHYEATKRLVRAELGAEAAGKNKTPRYQAVPYVQDMKLALAAATIVVGRAGSSIAEFAAFGKPAILIPLQESANDHQRLNAYEFAKTGGAVVVEEGNLLPGIFLKQITDILKNPGIVAKMSDASKKFFKPDAARVIAEELLRL